MIKTKPMASSASADPISTKTTTSNSSCSRSSHDGMNWIEILIWMCFISPLYILYRILIANQLPILDCDEVYNYYEPLHYLLYGTGLQTWEYSYQYALRSYVYLLPLYYISKYIYIPITYTYEHYLFWFAQEYLMLHSSTGPPSNHKVLLFLLLRCTIAIFTAIGELMFIMSLYYYSKKTSSKKISSSTSSSLTTKDDDDNNNHMFQIHISTVIWTMILLLLTTGMNHSSNSFLPSSTWMTIWCSCTCFYLYEYYIMFAITAISTTLGVGWPFGCVCIIPMSIHILYKLYNRNSIFSLVRYLFLLLFITVVVQYNVMKVDEHYYGIKYVSPTYNIFKYNASGNGDTLYGVEPLSYYIKNLILNLNILSIFGFITLPLYIINSLKQGKQMIDSNIFVVLLSLPIWCMITLPRPHKEERFLFPIYPVIILSSVLTIQCLVQYSMSYNNQNTKAKAQQSQPKKSSIIIRMIQFIINILLYHSQIIPCILYTISIMISISRTMALSKYYTAPFIIYNYLAAQSKPSIGSIHQKHPQFQYSDITEFVTTTTNHNITTQKQQQQSYVCTCAEWYRYPSSFYLPDNVQLGYLPSESFYGQLPQPFTQYGSKKESIKYLNAPFNDMNMNHTNSYINLQYYQYQCNWYIVLQKEDTNNRYCGWPVLYGKDRVHIHPYLDSVQTKSSLHRILYIPGHHEHAIDRRDVIYDDYVLYQEHNVRHMRYRERVKWNQPLMDYKYMYEEYKTLDDEHDNDDNTKETVVVDNNVDNINDEL